MSGSSLSTLVPVFGFNSDGSFRIAPPPAVLQFPGVPQLIGAYGNRLGISGGGGDINASAGTGQPFGGASDANLAGLPNAAVPGIGGSLDTGYSPYGQALDASLRTPLTRDDPGSLFVNTKWGIFTTDLDPIAPWDSVVKIDYRHEMKISDFPIERGAFASYNKVQVPFDIRISFAVGSKGGIATRTKFLADLEFAVQSLQMYIVITPEATYSRANLTHMEYSRESRRGLNLLVVDVWVQEVRVSEGSAFTDNTSGISPPYQPSVDKGAVQAQPVATPSGTGLTIADQPGFLPVQVPGGPLPVTDVPMPTRGSGGTGMTDAPSGMPTGSGTGNPADSGQGSGVTFTNSPIADVFF
jgi:hypothetical protein